MPRISEMIADTVESWTERWKERMRGFVISVIDLGMEALFHAMGKNVAPFLKPIIEEAEASDAIPNELKPLFAAIKDPQGEGISAIATMMGGSVAGGASSSMLAPWFALLNQKMSLKFPWQLFDPTTAFIVYYRDAMTKEDLYDMMKRAGYKDEWTDAMEQAYLGRLPEDRLRDLYLRGEIDEAKVREELKGQGWTKDRITELMKLWFVLPSPRDLVDFMAHEVFEPEMVTRYGLDSEFEGLDLEYFKKVGISPEIAKQYWRDHWQHASWTQVTEMLHRGVITKEEVYDWYRLVEIPPFWRDKLTAMSWNVPTRVDVRRFWDMGTIDETRLRYIYTAMGYHDQDLEDYILWTKVYVAFPDLVSRFRNSWITLDDVMSKLKGLGMSEDRATTLIQTKIKPMQEERTAGERDLTKSEIIKGIKKGVISVSEGLGLLVEMGYDEEESAFIISINIDLEESIPEIVAKRDLAKTDILNALKKGVISLSDCRVMLTDLGYDTGEADILILTKLELTSLTELDALQVGGSPTSFSGYKALVAKFKKAKGSQANMPSPELVKVERELKAAKDALASARATSQEPSYLQPYLQALSTLEQKYMQLLRERQQAP